MADKKHIVIIGAGVTGLTSAVFLAEAGYDLTVIAAHVPGDSSIEYTSPWAGAHWRTSATPAKPMICDWDVQTFDWWAEQLEREEREGRVGESGLKMQTSYGYYDSEPQEDLWWAPHVKDFAQLSPLKAPLLSLNRDRPSTIPEAKYGTVCRAPSLNVPKYLLWLQTWAQRLGVQIVKARLSTSSGLEAALREAERRAQWVGRRKVDLFLNATGLGAARLCNDTAMHPIRGQTVLVKGEAYATRTRLGDGYTAYCIPRPGSGQTILGGTKEVGAWSEEPDPKVTAQILERGAVLAPELLTAEDGGFEVVSVQCGLRPGRHGGPRMEVERLGGRTVVHAYGHASGGYQNSVGSARLVVKMVGEALGDGKSGEQRAKL